VHPRTLFRTERGNVAILTGILMPVIIGAAALGGETTYWYYTDLQLQNAADKAAYTAALERRAGSTMTVIETAATASAQANGFTPGTVTVNIPPLSGTHQNTSSVEVILDQDLPRYFTAVFKDGSVAETARAVATFQTSANACILALHPSASKAALFSGSSDVNLIGCNVMSNSIASDAVRAQGSAKLAADCLISVGGAVITSGVHLSQCSAPITQAAPVSDPFADVPTPTATGACKSTGGASLSAGRYCSGMSLSGTVNLAPGTYYVSGGDFKINANANITGTGVTIYAASGTKVSMNGNATVNLSAPTSGTYSGMLFMGDRSGASTNNTFNGTAASKLTGAIYFAGQFVNYLGNFSGNGGCTQIVAKTIEWSGNTTINQNCTAYGMKNIPASQLVKLVE
jgi:Flp pilus assembly protein TadG